MTNFDKVITNEMYDKVLLLSKSGCDLDEISLQIGKGSSHVKRILLYATYRQSEMQSNPKSLFHLGLDHNVVNILKRSGIDNIDQLLQLKNENPGRLLEVRNLGMKTFNVIMATLKEYALHD